MQAHDTAQPGPTSTLSEFVSELRYQDLPAEVVAKAKHCVLDQLGVQLAASTLEWNRITSATICSLGSEPESTLVNYGEKRSAAHAAFVNGTFGHGCEFDDLGPNFGHGHPGCAVIPAGIAMAEKVHANGKALIAAVVAGYEVQGRISVSCSHSILKRGFHLAWFVFGAISAAGKMLEMDPHALGQAYGIGGSFAGGVRQYTKSGGESKRLHAGAAGHNGILSVLLAQGGFSAPPDILEGQTGFVKAFADTYSFDPLTKNLGRDFLILETAFKLVPCCGGIVSSLSTVTSLIDELGIDARAIARVTIRLGSTRIDQVGKIYQPENVLGAQFSLPFVVALAVVKRRLDLAAFMDPTLWRDAEIAGFIEKIRLEVDAAADKPYSEHVQGHDHRSSGSVELTLRDGTTIARTNRPVKGLPGGAAVSWQELAHKFETNVGPILGTRQVYGIVEMVDRLEEVDDIAELMGNVSRHK